MRCGSPTVAAGCDAMTRPRGWVRCAACSHPRSCSKLVHGVGSFLHAVGGQFWTPDETGTGLGTRVVGSSHFVDSRRGYRWHARLCSGSEAVMNALPVSVEARSLASRLLAHRCVCCTNSLTRGCMLQRAVLPIAEQLLGVGQVDPPAPSGTEPDESEELWTPRWTRGVYATLPGAKRKTDHSGIHTDGYAPISALVSVAAF